MEVASLREGEWRENDQAREVVSLMEGEWWLWR